MIAEPDKWLNPPHSGQHRYCDSRVLLAVEQEIVRTIEVEHVRDYNVLQQH